MRGGALLRAIAAVRLPLRHRASSPRRFSPTRSREDPDEVVQVFEDARGREPLRLDAEEGLEALECLLLADVPCRRGGKNGRRHDD